MKKFILLSTTLFLSLILHAQVQIGQHIDGEAEFDRSGSSISLSSNGNLLAIGAIDNDGNGFDSGHVRVFQNINGVWNQVGQDIDGENTNDQSGISVSLSYDGNIVAIGADRNDGNGSNSGHVRVFQNINDTWTQIGQDIDGETQLDESGITVSLSSDGTIVAIGAMFNDGENTPNSGHVRVFQNINGVWSQVGQDIDGEAEFDQSGSSISLSSDGNILAIGAINNDENGPSSGQVRVYENLADSWIQIGQDIDGEAVLDLFGSSISLSSDGDTLAIGARLSDGNGEDSGQVRVFQNVNGTWIQVGQNIDGEAEFDQSGSSISLSSDGNILAIGAPNNDGNGNVGNFPGHVRIYQNQEGNWIQIGQDIDGEEELTSFAFSVSLSSDGTTLAIGAPLNNSNGLDSGQVRVFDLSALLSVEESTITQFDLFPNPAKDFLNIQLQQGVVLENINIYNNLGQFIQSSKESIMDTSGLRSGLYFVEVITNTGKASQKLIIE